MCISICSVSQSCPTLCDPMDCSPPGSSSVHGILQARILEWVVISFSWRSSPPRIEFESLTTPALAAGFFLPLEATGKSHMSYMMPGNVEGRRRREWHFVFLPN